MARRQFQLNHEQVKDLMQAYLSCKDGPTRIRYQAVRLYGTGYPLQEVLEITGCSRLTLMEWCRKYGTGGVNALTDHRVGGNRAKLSPEQLAQLKARLHCYTPADLFGTTAATADGQFWTLPDLGQAIEQWYGVCYQSPRSYLRCFERCGFSYQRPAKVYQSRKESQVAEFEAQLEKN
jgi:transposase